MLRIHHMIQYVCRCAYATYDDSAYGWYAWGSAWYVQPSSRYGGPWWWRPGWSPSLDDGSTNANTSSCSSNDATRRCPRGYDETSAPSNVWRPKGALTQSSARAQLKTCILIDSKIPIYRYCRRLNVIELWISNAARKFRSILCKTIKIFNFRKM